MKYLESIDFEPAKVNTFDIQTCEGMKQVAMINEEARHAQIGYDDSIAEEIKDIKVEIVEKMTKENAELEERSRVLLKENLALKKVLIDKGIIDENMNMIEGGGN